MAEEATVNPDGSTTFENAEGFAGDAGEDMGGDTPMMEEEAGVDPALYLVAALAVLATIVYLVKKRRVKMEEEDDDFFANLDGAKFDIRLPDEVEQYYQMKEKCEENGYIPGQTQISPEEISKNPNNPHRMLAQALMKRAMADIPLVQHIQREAPGMNKLYSQSMCSVKQWRNYQAAEAMVSAEVEEVRAEADEIEAGWSQLIWRQAMQYQGMLKAKHEQEQAALNRAKEMALKKQAEVQKAKALEDAAKAKIEAAEKAAEELLKEEERKKEASTAFNGGGMKKGFLDSKKKK